MALSRIPKNGSGRRDIYQEVTDLVLEAIENGTVPWQRPWKVIGVPPTNLYSRKKYRGINVFLLGMTGYASPFWVTFKQAQDLLYKQWCRDNGKTINDPASQAEYNRQPIDERRVVPKGTKGHLVVFFKPVPNKNYRKGSQDPKEQNKNILILKHYTVFNVEQVADLRIPANLMPELVEDHDPIPAAQEIIDHYAELDGPQTGLGGDSAYYIPMLDYIAVPLKEQYEDISEYYKTHYHEMAHSTGHEKRLNRREVVKVESSDKIEAYSVEELVAEMTAAMLAGVAGLEFSYENTANYLAHWGEKIQADKRILVRAAARAQRASDHILGEAPFDPDAAETTTEKELVPA